MMYKSFFVLLVLLTLVLGCTSQVGAGPQNGNVSGLPQNGNISGSGETKGWSEIEKHLYILTGEVYSENFGYNSYATIRPILSSSNDPEKTDDTSVIHAIKGIPNVKVYADDKLLGETNENGILDVYDFFCIDNYNKTFTMSFSKTNWSRCWFAYYYTQSFEDKQYNQFNCPDYVKSNSLEGIASNITSYDFRDYSNGSIGIYPYYTYYKWGENNSDYKGHIEYFIIYDAEGNIIGAKDYVPKYFAFFIPAIMCQD